MKHKNKRPHKPNVQPVLCGTAVIEAALCNAVKMPLPHFIIREMAPTIEVMMQNLMGDSAPAQAMREQLKTKGCRVYITLRARTDAEIAIDEKTQAGEVLP